jgi:collagen beta-1,O-galactosyltransferase
VIAKGYDKVLIFEDDIRFEPFFVAKLENMLTELDGIRDMWDLVFLGKRFKGVTGILTIPGTCFK